MVILNGKKFAETDSEFTDSLFDKEGGTCVGYIKGNKKTATILNMQKKKVGVITCHRVMAKATKLSDILKDPNAKGYSYSYGDIDIVGRYESYRQEVEDIDKVIDKYNLKNIASL